MNPRGGIVKKIALKLAYDEIMTFYTSWRISKKFNRLMTGIFIGKLAKISTRMPCRAMILKLLSQNFN